MYFNVFVRGRAYAAPAGLSTSASHVLELHAYNIHLPLGRRGDLFLMSASVLPVCMYVHHVCAWCLW